MRNLDPYWMPFTANRAFKKAPRMLVAAKGHYYTDDSGRQLLDGFSGLWTSGLGHCHPRIVEAVQQQVATLDYSMAFQMATTRLSSWPKKWWRWRRPASPACSSPTRGPSRPTRR